LSTTITSTSREYHLILACVPLLALELAGDHTVRAIEPAAEARTDR